MTAYMHLCMQNIYTYCMYVSMYLLTDIRIYVFIYMTQGLKTCHMPLLPFLFSQILQIICFKILFSTIKISYF